MEKTALIVATILLALASYFALARPVLIIQFLYGCLSLWARLFNSNVLTHEQSSRVEMARNDPRGYESSHYSQVTMVRVMGFISMLVAVALLCMAFT